MKSTIRHALLLLLGLMALGTLSHCVSVGDGGTTVGNTRYAKGSLKQTFDASARDTAVAIETAAQNLLLIKIRAEQDDSSGTFIFRTNNNHRIKIAYKSTPEHATEVAIRVGFLGDENLSTRVMRAIEKTL